MIYIRLTDNVRRPLAFFLALEEWVARQMPAGEYIFDWSVGPTVIIGRNQDLDTEVNRDYCRQHGIDIVRRRSGGGCVFADDDNIMFSYITASTEVKSTFSRFTERMAGQLRRLGIGATVGGRNDILVGDRKISGSAFYHLSGRSIVHGTMLYDTDIRHMLNAITPSRAKLASKKVQSVASRIVTARELLPQMSFKQFHEKLLEGIAETEYTLTAEQEQQVCAIEQNYYVPGWLERAGHKGGATASIYVHGVGTVAVTLTLDHEGKIRNSLVHGDFMAGDGADMHALDGHTLQQIDNLCPVAAMPPDAFAALVRRAAQKYREKELTRAPKAQ